MPVRKSSMPLAWRPTSKPGRAFLSFSTLKFGLSCGRISITSLSRHSGILLVERVFAIRESWAGGDSLALGRTTGACSWVTPQSQAGWMILCPNQSCPRIQVMAVPATSNLMLAGLFFLDGEGPPLGAGTESPSGRVPMSAIAVLMISEGGVKAEIVFRAWPLLSEHW